MIDFHTHILPNIDDGSRSVEQSLAMLREEASQGVDTVVLTPHFYASQNDVETFLRRRAASWAKLQPALTADLPQLRLGAEVQYFEGICYVESLPKLKIEGTDLLLLEMPFSKWTDRMISDAIDLNDGEDIQVVLAHIERYLRWQPRDITDTLTRNGLLIQSNASFFINWKTRHKAISMVQKGEIHILGSDCHNLKDRAPNLSQGFQILGRRAEGLRTTL